MTPPTTFAYTTQVPVVVFAELVLRLGDAARTSGVSIEGKRRLLERCLAEDVARGAGVV
jgi:hypothetical protein